MTSRLASFFSRRQPPDERKPLFDRTLHHWDFGFVWSLFNPHGSTGRALLAPTLRVVPGLTAVAARAASRLPKSRLIIFSFRHAGSLVRAGALFFRKTSWEEIAVWFVLQCEWGRIVTAVFQEKETIMIHQNTLRGIVAVSLLSLASTMSLAGT